LKIARDRLWRLVLLELNFQHGTAGSAQLAI